MVIMIVILYDNNILKRVLKQSDSPIKKHDCIEKLPLSYSYLMICYYNMQSENPYI